MDNNRNIFKLPAIKGIIGDWVYYQTALPFKKVAEMIDNNHSIREYQSLDDYLQRGLSRRSKKIKEYLNREDSRFFNSAIIGIYGENPNWYRFDFSPSAIPEMSLPDEILNSIGILEFSGGEILFSIDGQHRIDGIKQAIESNDSDRFNFDELPVIIIGHNETPEGKRRTRRLFSEINTKAVKVTGLDDLITNEDNPISINARRIFAEIEYFEKDTLIALNAKANIDSEADEFTTILNIQEVNKTLYKPSYTHRDFRPSDTVIEELYQISKLFWDGASMEIPSYKLVIRDKTESVSQYRNSDGGSMLFRPIGINILAEAYVNWKSEKSSLTGFWEAFRKLDAELNGNHWKDVLWDNAKKVIKKPSVKLKREYTKYLLGLSYDQEYVTIEYNKLKGIENEEDRIALPEHDN